MTRILKPRSLPLLLCLTALMAMSGGMAAYRMTLSRISTTLDQSLILTRRSIETEIDRFRYLPQVTAQDIRIRRAIAEPFDADVVYTANHYLETVAGVSGADQLYLLDRGGITIAASNWNTDSSFLGFDYSFRPYFLDAITEGTGRFYAIGVTTGQPGYFLSSRVDLAGGQRGVLVVKIDLAPLQQAWRSAAVDTAIADADGIVFLSGQSSWLYRPLFALGAGTLDHIATTRRYEGAALDTAAPLLGAEKSALQSAQPIKVAGRSLLMRRLPMAPDDWQVIMAASVAGAWRTALAVAAISALTTIAAALLVQTFLQRRRLVRMRLQQSRLLEKQVDRRTRELADEIEIRMTAETDLRAAHEALIHAEKMAALGRMSTAIVHEISQPLAAMEATLAAAVIGARKMDPATTTRIETARGHIRRMLRTIKHLKSFGRKENGALSRVDLDLAVDNALDLVRHRADGMGVTLTLERIGNAPAVTGSQVRLEQVLVNLLLNALDAVAPNTSTGHVTVLRETLRDAVIVQVKDNGVGIDADSLPKIKEPFYSHKQGGDRLGLGLSICQTIVEDAKGTLTFNSAPGNGTNAVLTLPLAIPKVKVDAA
ncbi:MAG: sensor histidine kinase [Rhodobacterales bacterium]|nr:ATP-binding protein [Puniceibacterium antarcticum]